MADIKRVRDLEKLDHPPLGAHVVIDRGEGVEPAAVPAESVTSGRTTDTTGVDQHARDAIAQETTDRSDADDLLRTAISQEILDRQGGDAALQAAIDQEVVDRKAAIEAAGSSQGGQQGGQPSEIPDDSIAFAKILAGTAAQKLGWRGKIESTKIAPGIALPDLTEAGDGDIVIMIQDVSSGLSFIDISDMDTEVTSAKSTDIIMAITIARDNRKWVRLGNIFEAHQARMDAANAKTAADTSQSGVDRLSGIVDELDHLTSDLDTITDGPGLIDAPAAEAGMAIFARGGTVGDGLLDGNRDLVASDLTGYAWLSSTVLGAERQAVIIRVKKGLNPLDFYLQAGTNTEQVRTSDLVLSDANWGYYFLGGEINVSIAVKKRNAAIHTRYHGELAGRALAQLEKAGLIFEDPSNPIEATGENTDRLLFRAGWLYENRVAHNTDQVVAYRDFATADIGIGGYIWGGAHQINPHARDVAVNTVIYSIPANLFERSIEIGGGIPNTWVVYNLPNFKGQAANNSDADRRVSAVGDVVFFGGKVQIVDSITPSVPDRWQWEPLAGSPALIHAVDALNTLVGELKTELDGKISDNKALIDANKVKSDRLTVFGSIVLNPGGIPGNDFPEFLGLTLANKIDPRRIVSIRVRIGGQQAAAAVSPEDLAPFNDTGSGDLTQPGMGGILNLVLGSAARANLKTASPSSIQYVRGEIEYKFDGTSLQPDVLPDVIDHFSFAVNNNGYPAIVGLTQSQVDARVEALRRNHFETAVGASPAVLPVGTRKLVVEGNHGGVRFSKSIRVGSLTAAAIVWAMDVANADTPQSGRDAYFRTQYVVATRTLTYSYPGVSLGAIRLVAIGES